MPETELSAGNAKKLFSENKYDDAYTMYSEIWENSEKKDPFLLFNYGRSLRKVNKSIVFVNIYRNLDVNNSAHSNSYVISILCWCLYDSYIKDFTETENINEFDLFLKRARFIIDSSEQKKANEFFHNPYVLTIKKVVKAYNNRSSTNYNEIINWLNFLDPNILSEETYNFIDEHGKDRELASPKEFYYQQLAKCLEKNGRYKDCIKICKLAFENIKKFHYRNDMWIKGRMYYSKCMVEEDIDSAINSYKIFADKCKYWFLYHKLSQIYFRHNKISDALLYASKSIVLHFEHEKMVNLLFDLGQLWQANGSNSNASLFYQASAYYRNRYEWNIPEELQFEINSTRINIEKTPNVKNIISISVNYIQSVEGIPDRSEGLVIKIFPHGGSGFIKFKHQNENIYFSKGDINKGETVSVGDTVFFEIISTKDNKTKAIQITKRT